MTVPFVCAEKMFYKPVSDTELRTVECLFYLVEILIDDEYDTLVVCSILYWLHRPVSVIILSRRK